MLFAAFNGGGYFAGTPAVLAVCLGMLLVLRVTLGQQAFHRFSAPVAVAALCLGLFGGLTLLSAVWSEAPARAMIEFDRILLYLFAFSFAASFPLDLQTLRWAVRALGLAAVIVATVGLVSRVLPDLLSVTERIATDRLSYPVTYWNALGLLAGTGLLTALHLTASEREPAPVRVLAAATMPITAATLYFTFSRGAMAVTLIGALVYIVVARPRGALGAVLTVGPTVSVAIALAHGAELLASDKLASPAAIAQGHDLALGLAATVVAAAALRLVALRIDAAVVRMGSFRPRQGRVALVACLAAAIAALAVALMSLGGVGWATDQLDEFRAGSDGESGDLRGRLTSVSNNGRLQQWRVALRAFEAEPVIGHGAGTFGLVWARERESTLKVEDAHSLYLNTLAELGVIGFVLLVAALAATLVALMGRCRGPNRHVHALVLALSLAWAMRASIDWDWELPVVTACVFALAGLALAQPRATSMSQRAPARLSRVVVALALLAVIVTPALVAVSQGRLNAAVTDFKRGDCVAAIDEALAALRAVPVRPEPFEVLGYCDFRLQRRNLAIRMFEAAVRRDRQNWELHYGLALVRAGAGQDPRPAARNALALNPREPLARDAVERFRTSNPRLWQRRARRAPIPIL